MPATELPADITPAERHYITRAASVGIHLEGSLKRGRGRGHTYTFRVSDNPFSPPVHVQRANLLPDLRRMIDGMGATNPRALSASEVLG